MSNRYKKIIKHIFFEKYEEGETEIVFERKDLREAADELAIELPKNLGDIIYSFRYRTQLPKEVKDAAPEGSEWVIRGQGPAKYAFGLAPMAEITPNKNLAKTKVPDSTPGMISRYAMNDEQALLAKLRYNRLVDIFTGVTCYSLQNHLRTTVDGFGQVETDEVYVGVNKGGAHYVIPVQAKGGSDKLSIVQIEQDVALCKEKFPGLICRAIGAQFMEKGLIALFVFEETGDEESVVIASEKHYQLVSPSELSEDDLRNYRQRLPAD